MEHQPIDHLHNATSQHQLTYPLHEIVATLARSDIDRAVALLREAGFARNRIEVIIVEEVPRLEGLLGGTGLHRFLVRLQLITGDEFDELEQARRELMNGHALIQILVHGEQEQDRVRTILPARWQCRALLWEMDD
ncbi:MAG: hypothetical protein ACR2OE_17990 [Thermomicrobiales bacterium]